MCLVISLITKFNLFGNYSIQQLPTCGQYTSWCVYFCADVRFSEYSTTQLWTHWEGIDPSRGHQLSTPLTPSRYPDWLERRLCWHWILTPRAERCKCTCLVQDKMIQTIPSSGICAKHRKMKSHVVRNKTTAWDFIVSNFLRHIYAQNYEIVIVFYWSVFRL